MFSMIVALAALAGVLYLGWRVWTRYHASTAATVWGKLLDAGNSSASILWQYVVMAGGFVLTAISKGSDLFDMPEFKTLIQENLSPELAGGVLVAIAVLGIVARLRTLRS